MSEPTLSRITRLAREGYRVTVAPSPLQTDGISVKVSYGDIHSLRVIAGFDLDQSYAEPVGVMLDLMIHEIDLYLKGTEHE